VYTVEYKKLIQKLINCEDILIFMKLASRLKHLIKQRKNKSNLKEVRIEITDKCNLNCSFCFNKNNGDPSLSQIKKIIDNVCLSGVNAIRLTGGEPFLRKDLTKIVSYAKEKGLYVIVNTNGTLLRNGPLKYIDHILISFHDPKKRIKEILNKLKTHNVVVMLATILIKKNIECLEEFYKIAQEIEYNDWFFLRPIGNTSIKEMGLAIQEISRLNKQYNKDFFIANAVPFCISNKADSVCVGGINDGGRSRIVVDTKGDIKTDYYSQKILGNVSINQIGKIFDSLNSFLPKECNVCKHKIKCLGGINNDPLITKFKY
jgi:MoaA/NifB/PqqE/SkfB family radical SAM enzyme